jgi:U2-associated protein SR140
MDKTKSKLAAFFDRDDEESSLPVRRTKLFLCSLTLTISPIMN